MCEGCKEVLGEVRSVGGSMENCGENLRESVLGCGGLGEVLGECVAM